MPVLGNEPKSYDLAIIGGGINGCGIARDAAGRGYSVFLCEADDLAIGTSSRSTKLIHGGLRYLEHFDFRLVRESLIEREVLWRIAPHIVRPMRFILPYREGLRPAWMLRVGLFLYDHLGGREQLPGTRVLDLKTDIAGQCLKPGVFPTGFEYSDCWVDDARLVVLNARDAADRGAVIRTRTRALAAARTGAGWRLTVEDQGSGANDMITARVLVNAAGPWVGTVLEDTVGQAMKGRVRLVQGSHIVVPKLFDHGRAYLFQNPDGRVVFAIPYEQDFTLIGTTDRDYKGEPGAVSATPEEVAYLCDAANVSFRQQITPADVIWSYSGVRPLYDDGASEAQAASREYVLELDARSPSAPLLSVIGGKITVYRRLAETALERLEPYLPQRTGGLARGWSGTAPLPGGDLPPAGMPSLIDRMSQKYPFLAPAQVRRLASAYGTRAFALLDCIGSEVELGQRFGATLTEREARYLIDNEWARSAQDIVWRRSKLGLRLSEAQLRALETWLLEHVHESAKEPAR